MCKAWHGSWLTYFKGEPQRVLQAPQGSTSQSPLRSNLTKQNPNKYTLCN